VSRWISTPYVFFVIALSFLQYAAFFIWGNLFLLFIGVKFVLIAII